MAEHVRDLAALADILTRFRDMTLTEIDRSAPTHAATLRADGSWPDLDYASQARAGWPPSRHLDRSLNLAAQGLADEHSLAAAVRALDHWAAAAYQCSNWWWNQIGVPRAMIRALAILADRTPPHTRAALLDIVCQSAYPFPSASYPYLYEFQGANLIWRAEILLVRGCLTADPGTVAFASRQIADEIKITTGEGIQPDLSFHQHRQRLQTGHYGITYSSLLSRIALLLRGTPWAVPESKLQILWRFVHDGQRWVVHGRHWNPSVLDRSLSRPRAHLADEFLHTHKRLATLTGEPATRDQPADPGPVGHRHFWRSDYSVIRQPDWAASVKVISNRTFHTEVGGNGENARGNHLAEGLTLYLRRGDEYANVLPHWNWQHLPGVTAVRDGSHPQWGWDTTVRPGSTFSGGVSNGTLGALCMTRDVRELDRLLLAGRFAWFLTPRGILCLGCDIRSDSPHPVITGIDQRSLCGPVSIVSPTGLRVVNRLTTCSTGDAIHHDGWYYHLLAAPNASVSLERRSARWRDISSAESVEQVDADVFEVFIDHGPQPPGTSYAYAVAATPTVGMTLLSNTPSLQAVLVECGTVLAVFHQPGELTWPSGRSLHAHAPCLLILPPLATNQLAWVADPTGTQFAAQLTIDGRRISQPLPTGDLAGSSIAIVCP